MPIDELREDDLPALQRLARACLEADGGLPAFADIPLLRARLLWAHKQGMVFPPYILKALRESVDLYRERALRACSV